MRFDPSTRRRANAGFSIMELLLVLVILAVLTGIVTMKFGGLSGKSKVTAAETELENLKTSLDRYEMTVGDYPTTSEGLDALYERPSSVDEEDWEQIMEDDDFSDPWNNPWQYRKVDEDNRSYELYSYGPDGREGGDDDIRSWVDD